VSNQIVDPALYDKNYFLTDNDGWREWEKGLDSKLHPKFKRALELAGSVAGKNVLDIGCGRGELIYYCVKNGSSALGIDYSQAAIEIANQTLKCLPLDLRQKAKVAVGNAESYNFTERYDLVFMIEVAEHIYDWQLREAVDRIKSILNPGGKLIIMTPNYLYEKWFSPIKRVANIPSNLFKWPLRIIRGKYRPKSFQDLFGKIFKVKVDRGELNRKMHVNVTTRAKLKSYLQDFDAKVYCTDHSKNLLSLIAKKWFGRDIEAIAIRK
jgi:2-polyprenyl-3-methyl-5-hydroxy-6-metoxy-1,4-benzoquinol methylase